MTSELSIFAARLRDFIAICVGEFASSDRAVDPALEGHADAEFNGLAMVLFALQFSHNPAYAKFCAARNMFPDAVTHWTQIPAVPTSAFKDLELTCLATGDRTRVFHSSGTTEQRPSWHFHCAESMAVYEASLLPWFRLHVGQPGRLVILTPPASEAPHSSLVHMFDVIRRDENAPESVFLGQRVKDGSWVVDFDSAVTQLQAACDNAARVVLPGTAFSFVQLLDHLAENNLRFRLPPDSRVMETGGYKGRSRVLPKAKLHEIIAQRLGISSAQIVCEYGMSELSSQAYDNEVRNAECEVRGFNRTYHFPPWARVRVISPETGRGVAQGETGLLRIFDLANVFSVMAIQTEDLAIRRGDGFELVGRAALAEPRGCSLMSLEPLPRLIVTAE
jgi:hypothetical protein